jgi:hypothetical protein
MSFPHPLSDDEFRKLIRPSIDDDGSVRRDERRQFKRFAVRIELRCQGLSERWESTGKTIAGITLNMSRGGVQFDTTAEIYAKIVLVQFMSGDEVIAERAVRIDRRTPAHGAAVMAGEFVIVPSDGRID